MPSRRRPGRDRRERCRWRRTEDARAALRPLCDRTLTIRHRPGALHRAPARRSHGGDATSTARPDQARRQRGEFVVSLPLRDRGAADVPIRVSWWTTSSRVRQSWSGPPAVPGAASRSWERRRTGQKPSGWPSSCTSDVVNAGPQPARHRRAGGPLAGAPHAPQSKVVVFSGWRRRTGPGSGTFRGLRTPTSASSSDLLESVGRAPDTGPDDLPSRLSSVSEARRFREGPAAGVGSGPLDDALLVVNQLAAGALTTQSRRTRIRLAWWRAHRGRRRGCEDARAAAADKGSEEHGRSPPADRVGDGVGRHRRQTITRPEAGCPQRPPRVTTGARPP